MAARKHPSPEMLKDLNKLFTKHNWSGEAIGLQDAAGDLEDTDDCPDGKTPKEVTYKLPDGTWVTKTICV
jgi:hypothetical protein